MTPSFTRWLKSVRANLSDAQRNRSRPTVRLARSPRLGVECLEDRTVPATHTYTNGGAFIFWTDAGNWSGGAPAVGEAPLVILNFPGTGVASTQNIGPGLVINQINFTGTTNTVTLAQPLGLDGSTGTQLVNTFGVNTITGGTSI